MQHSLVLLKYRNLLFDKLFQFSILFLSHVDTICLIYPKQIMFARFHSPSVRCLKNTILITKFCTIFMIYSFVNITTDRAFFYFTHEKNEPSRRDFIWF